MRSIVLTAMLFTTSAMAGTLTENLISAHPPPEVNQYGYTSDTTVICLSKTDMKVVLNSPIENIYYLDYLNKYNCINPGRMIEVYVLSSEENIMSVKIAKSSNPNQIWWVHPYMLLKVKK